MPHLRYLSLKLRVYDGMPEPRWPPALQRLSVLLSYRPPDPSTAPGPDQLHVMIARTIASLPRLEQLGLA